MFAAKLTVPPFADLHKSAKDLFKKGFVEDYGFVKVDWKVKRGNTLPFEFRPTLNGRYRHDTGSIDSALELKGKSAYYGLAAHGKASTDTRVEVDLRKVDLLLSGTAMTVNFIKPPHGKASLKLKPSYKDDRFHIEMTADVLKPTVEWALVFRPFYSWLIGGRMAFDPQRNSFSAFEGAVGFHRKDLNFCVKINESLNCELWGYQKVNDAVKIGIFKTVDDSRTKYGLAVKYQPNQYQTFKAKLDNCSQLGLSFQQKLPNADVKVLLSALIDTRRLDQPTHKFGLGIEI